MVGNRRAIVEPLPPLAAAVLPDVLVPGLRLVFCGTAAGHVSARVGAYYAGPGNRFWTMLHRTGLTPRLLAPSEFPLLPGFGIGLTDVVKTASGGDAVLPRTAFDPEGVRRRVRRVAPRILAFNGRRSAVAVLGRPVAAAGPQPETLGPTALWVLPSTSGAARRTWDEAPWFALAEAVRAL